MATHAFQSLEPHEVEVPRSVSELKSNSRAAEYDDRDEHRAPANRAVRTLAVLLVAMKDWIHDGSDDSGTIIL